MKMRRLEVLRVGIKKMVMWADCRVRGSGIVEGMLGWMGDARGGKE